MDDNERLVQDGHLSTDCVTYVEFAFSYNVTCEEVDVDGIPLSVICPVSCLICEGKQKKTNCFLFWNFARLLFLSQFEKY